MAIGKISKYYTDRFDIGQLDITISPRHTYNNIVTAEESKAEGNYRKGEHDHYHGLGVEGFVEAIDAIKNPIEIYDGTGRKKGANPRIVSLINTKKSGTLLAVIEFYKDEQVYNGDGRRTHALLTIYGKDNLHDYINAIQKNNKVLDINNEQSHSSTTVQSGSNLSETVLKQNIAQFNQYVNKWKTNRNIAYSIPDTDSEGRKLTPEQREFFKNSKVVFLIILLVKE